MKVLWACSNPRSWQRPSRRPWGSRLRPLLGLIPVHYLSPAAQEPVDLFSQQGLPRRNIARFQLSPKRLTIKFYILQNIAESFLLQFRWIYYVKQANCSGIVKCVVLALSPFCSKSIDNFLPHRLWQHYTSTASNYIYICIYNIYTHI